MGPESAHGCRQFEQAAHIVRGPHGPSQPFEPMDRQVGCPLIQIVRLTRTHMSGDQMMVESLGIQPPHEGRDLDGRTTDIHSRDDSHHA